jgi:hypothetical protein
MKKRAVWTALAFLALLGIANCVLIEPALASRENLVKHTDEVVPCSPMCHFAHHQWLGPQEAFDVNNEMSVVLYSPAPTIANIDPPVGAIFHPPTYL